VIKDFTVILQKNRDERNEVLAQLRGAYDGYLEKGVGNRPENPIIRAEASFGAIACVTPIIDMYTTVTLLLGERFLRIRHYISRTKITAKALENSGKEEQMREELADIVNQFLRGLEISKVEVSQELLKKIQAIAVLVAYIRTPVWRKHNQEEDEFYIPSEPEYPTRIVKQLLKLGKLLTIVRGKRKLGLPEIKTLIRVGRDSCPPKRWKTLNYVFLHPKATIKEIADRTGNNYFNARRVLTTLEAIGLIDSEGEREIEYFIAHKEISTLFPVIYKGVPPTRIENKESLDGYWD
jgi:hypothetical protein